MNPFLGVIKVTSGDLGRPEAQKKEFEFACDCPVTNSRKPKYLICKWIQNISQLRQELKNATTMPLAYARTEILCVSRSLATTLANPDFLAG